MSIQMVHEEDNIKFKESNEQIQREIKLILNNIINSFDNFLHPRHCKVKIDKNYLPKN